MGVMIIMVVVNVTRAEKELDWFFYQSEAAMGISSSFEPIRQMIFTGPRNNPSPSDSMDDRRIEATHKHRQILTRLTSVRPQEHVAVIIAAHQCRAWTQEMTQAFGKAVGVCSRTTAARKYYEEDNIPEDGFWAWLNSVACCKEQERINVIRLEATDLLRAAIKAYASI